MPLQRFMGFPPNRAVTGDLDAWISSQAKGSIWCAKWNPWARSCASWWRRR